MIATWVDPIKKYFGEVNKYVDSENAVIEYPCDTMSSAIQITGRENERDIRYERSSLNM